MSANRQSERSGFRKNTWLTFETVVGAASYTVGGDVYTSQVMNQIDRAVAIGYSNAGLRPLVVTGSVTGNRFRVQFYRNTGVDTIGRFTGEAASATDLSADTFTVLLEGK